MLVVAYLVLFLAAGAYSAISDWQEVPTLALVGEIAAVVVLAAGVLFSLLQVSLRPQILWLLPASLACLAELGIIVRDRRRTVESESLSRRDAFATDLLSALFFLPAVVINVRYAFR